MLLNLSVVEAEASGRTGVVERARMAGVAAENVRGALRRSARDVNSDAIVGVYCVVLWHFGDELLSY